MNNEQPYILDIEDGEEQEVVNLAGYQVTKAELFAHTREPAVTVWDNKIKFNMACLRRFPGVTHIQLLIHPEQQRLIIRPCEPDAPDSLRWANGGGEKEVKNRDMICQIFAAKLFDLMNSIAALAPRYEPPMPRTMSASESFLIFSAHSLI